MSVQWQCIARARAGGRACVCAYARGWSCLWLSRYSRHCRILFLVDEHGVQPFKQRVLLDHQHTHTSSWRVVYDFSWIAQFASLNSRLKPRLSTLLSHVQLAQIFLWMWRFSTLKVHTKVNCRRIYSLLHQCIPHTKRAVTKEDSTTYTHKSVGSLFMRGGCSENVSACCINVHSWVVVHCALIGGRRPLPLVLKLPLCCSESAKCVRRW